MITCNHFSVEWGKNVEKDGKNMILQGNKTNETITHYTC